MHNDPAVNTVGPSKKRGKSTEQAIQIDYESSQYKEEVLSQASQT